MEINIPLDLLYPVLDQLDRRDLVNTALVSPTFNHVTTPLLYRAISSHITEDNVLFHPCATLLRRPGLAQYVRKVTESGAVQLFRRVNPRIVEDIKAALRLCTNLESVRYIDNTDAPVPNFLPILRILVTLPLKELVIRTHHDLGEDAWALLNKIKGIRRISVWSLNSGPPRVLQGWADELSSTLTHLELGRCAGVPPTILMSVFLKLPLIRELAIKGVPSAAIPAIMECLPNLISLDTEYLGSGNYRVPTTPLPALEQLIIRTGSVDIHGPDKLWTWTRSILPHLQSLKSFTLNSFSIFGRMMIPWPFVIFLTTKQAQSLVEFIIIGGAMLNLDSLSQLCLKCPALKTVDCTIASPDVESIAKAISNADSLRTLSLQVIWVESSVTGSLAADICVDLSEDLDKPTNSTFYLQHPPLAPKERKADFSMEEARSMMLRPSSKLRAVRLGDFGYTGRWVLASGEPTQSDDRLIFEVVRDVSLSTL